MPVWKVLVVFLFGITCLGLVLATIIVPVTLTPQEGKWLWLAGLIVATLVMTTLFTLFLKSADRTFKR